MGVMTIADAWPPAAREFTADLLDRMPDDGYRYELLGGVLMVSAGPGRRPFTVSDLDQMPDDGRRYELVDGILMVSPAPSIAHQWVVGQLLILLSRVCPPELCALLGPGVEMSLNTELIPDLVVLREDQLIGSRVVTEPPLLAVEVQSPSTRAYDRSCKKAAYERFGVESYWLVVPDPGKPGLTAFELRGGRYEEVAHVVGDDTFRVERPFPAELVPAQLVAKLRTP
jgi:Uma2 family endonuclease